MKYDITIKTVVLLVFAGAALVVLQGCKTQKEKELKPSALGSSAAYEAACNRAIGMRPQGAKNTMTIILEKGWRADQVWAENIEGGFEPANYIGLSYGSRPTYSLDRTGENYTGLVLVDDCEFMLPNLSYQINQAKEAI